MREAFTVAGRPGPTAIRLLLVVLILTVAVAGLTPGPCIATPAVKNVLVIHSFITEYPASINFNNGLTARLQREPAWEFRFRYEALELGHPGLDDTYFLSLATVLREKYLNNRPDIVIVNGVPAARFLLANGRDIFGDIPVIVAINRQTHLAGMALPANYSLYYPPIDTAKTVELILALRPATEKLYVIIGRSAAERRLAGELPGQLAAFGPRLAIHYLDNLPLAGILNSIRQADKSAAILFVNFIADIDGNQYVPTRLLATICAEAPVPVFAVTDSQLGSGTVGGYLINTSALGERIGEKALGLLSGASPSGRAEAIDDVSGFMFDWRQLRRWEIDPGDLPPGSDVHNRPVSSWQANKWYILGGLTVIFIQAVLIALLVFNRRKRLQAEKELARLDRLHLAGEMAAGISHEIRNPLTAVRGYLQLLARRPRLPSADVLQAMIGELDRANNIISEFLNLAKNKTIELSPHNLNDIVNSLLPMLRSEANLRGHAIEFIADEVPLVSVDEKEIRQIVLNLIMNALDAMNGHGSVTIRTGRTEQRVILSVGDTGPGMPPDIAAQIGTPFFTTKATGTGLGLSVCFAIADRHNARLTFDTGPRGTIFHLALPLLPRTTDSSGGYPAS